MSDLSDSATAGEPSSGAATVTFPSLPPDATLSSLADSLKTQSPPSPPKTIAESSAPADQERTVAAKGGTHDLYFLPIPRRLQWDPEAPPKFTLLLNVIFGFSATFTVSNLYWPQPILIQMAETFGVPYSRVTNVPTLLQAAYAVGLLLISPLGDLVRRRQLLLILVLCSSLCALILALVPHIVPFEAVSFLIGLVSVTPQVLLPLAADLSPPERRASAISIVLAGMLLGVLGARVLAGIIAKFGKISDIWYMSFGLQVLIWGMLWATVPDYPAKNTHLKYRQILASMAKFAVTEPVLVQGCLIAFASAAIFSSFWTTSTFLLGEIYGYNSLEIGLFGLVGILGVCTAPFVGKLVDRLIPWVGVLIAIGFLGLSQVIFTSAAGVSIGAVIVCIFVLDVGQQMQQVSNSTRIFALNPAARARLSAVYIFSIFCGQLVGTKAGTTVYLKYGYRAVGGLCLAYSGLMLVILFIRGPHLATDRWVGWSGGWELRKMVAEEAKVPVRRGDDAEMVSEEEQKVVGGP